MLIDSPVQSGSPEDISDITSEAGWKVLECTETEEGSSHTIHVVCEGPEETCDHLLQGDPENKIIRLPENVSTFSDLSWNQSFDLTKCGQMPFARIKSWYTPDANSRTPTERTVAHHGVVILTVDSDFSNLTSSSYVLDNIL